MRELRNGDPHIGARSVATMTDEMPIRNADAFHGQMQQGDAQAELNLAAIAQAINAGAPICRHCMRPYEMKERPFASIVQFRSILHIPDSAPMPMVCDGCFEKSIATYNPRATVPGTNNSGYANLVLQQLG